MPAVLGLIFLISFSVFGEGLGFRCEEKTHVSKALTFEEGVDDYLMDIEETAIVGSLSHALTEKKDSSQFRFQFRMPKQFGEGPMRTSHCQFGGEGLLLMSCFPRVVKLTLTELKTSEEKTFDISYMNLLSSFVTKESLTHSGQVEKQSKLEFTMTFFGLPNTSPLTAVESFNRSSCKGLSPDSPARP